jgi:cell division protein ZapA
MEGKEKNRVTVVIMGEEYILRGTSTPDQISRVGHYVDQLMKNLAGTNPHMNRQKVAVLAALNLADELLKLKAEKELSSANAERYGDYD